MRSHRVPGAGAAALGGVRQELPGDEAGARRHHPGVSAKMLVEAGEVGRVPVAAAAPRRWIDSAAAGLLHVVEILAAVALAADLAVVALAVIWRFLFRDSLEWADEVARMLLISVAFLGGAAAVA